MATRKRRVHLGGDERGAVHAPDWTTRNDHDPGVTLIALFGFLGEWVPAKARCTSPLRLIIEPQVVTFVKGADRAEYRKLAL
jgi:hypothetical protein